MSAMLQIERLTVRYGPVIALDDVSVDVEAGLIHGIVGPNGSGKTTLLSVILGLLRPNSGRVLVDGRDIAQRGALDPVAGFVESPRFYPRLSALDNLVLLSTLDGRRDRGRAVDLLAAVGLAAVASRRAGTLSLGMRQRLGVAAALLREPLLLVLDEPANGLDPAGAADLRDLLHELAGNGVAVVVASHDLAEIERTCSRVSLIHAGRLAWTGPMARLQDQPGDRSIVVVTDDDRTAANVLTGCAGVSAAKLDGGGHRLTGPPTDVDRAVAQLVARGVHLRRLEQVRSPLEAAVLRLTGSRTSDPEGSAEAAPGEQPGRLAGALLGNHRW